MNVNASKVATTVPNKMTISAHLQDSESGITLNTLNDFRKCQNNILKRLFNEK